MDFYTGLGAGLSLGVLIVLFGAVMPMVRAFQRMRYDGFRPSEPPPRPKTVPPSPYSHIREGIN